MRPVPPDKIIEDCHFQIGKITYHVVVTEGWRPTDAGLVVKCGKNQTISCTSKLGISKTQTSTFKASLGATLGVKDVSSIQSIIETSVTHQVNWSEEKSVTVPVEFIAPECGAQLYYVFALVRTYKIRASKTRWIRPPIDVELPTLHEWTAIYRAHVVEDEQDDDCPCTPEAVAAGTPVTVGFRVGNLEIFAEAMRHSENTSLRLLGYVIETPNSYFAEGMTLTWPDPPDFLRYFSGDDTPELTLHWVDVVEDYREDAATETTSRGYAAEALSTYP